MPDNFHPDFLPSADGVDSLGQADNRWDKVYANAVSDGTRTIPVADLATADNAGLAVRALPYVDPFTDEGKILIVRNGEWVVEAYPAGTLPPVTGDHDGLVMQVDGGEWKLKRAMTLPPVDASMNGAILRVVAGQLVPWKYDGNPGGGAEAGAPCPVAPVEDDHILITSGGAWTTVKVQEKMVVPAMGATDVGKFLTVVPDGVGGWMLAYTHPPVVTTDAAGALPPLPGDARQFYNGAGGWSAVTAGNNGHWRVGDQKISLRQDEPGWLSCDGKSVGKEGSGADYAGDRYRALYALLDRTTLWPTRWNSGELKDLPIREYYKIRFSPDAQAPVETSILFEAAAVDGSHFVTELSPDMTFSALAWTFLSEQVDPLDPPPAGWYRLGGDYPEMLDGAGNDFSQPESIFLDVNDALTGLASVAPGHYYHRTRQYTGTLAAPVWSGAWTYGSILAVNYDTAS